MASRTELTTLAGIAGALALAGAADGAIAKEKKPALVSYQKDSGVGLGAFGGKLVHSYGYKDKKLDNGNWEVTGQAKSGNVEDSQYIAIYRAAEIAASQGKAYVKIVSVNGKRLSALSGGATTTATFSGPPISYGTRDVIEVELVDTPDAEANCATDVLRASCETIEVAGAMEEIRPHLNIKAGK